MCGFVSFSSQSTSIWDVRSGAKVKSFDSGAGVGVSPIAGAGALQWPYVKWSHDDAFLAVLGAEQVEVYDTATMQLLDNKPIKAPGMQKKVIFCF
jgi:uncharacterized protein with WD repeat